MRIVWTRPARDDRRSIFAYIAEENPRAALSLDEAFSEGASRLVDHPEIGRPGRLPRTRELVVHRTYLLIYALVVDEIRLLRVLHGARKWPPSDD